MNDPLKPQSEQSADVRKHPESSSGYAVLTLLAMILAVLAFVAGRSVPIGADPTGGRLIVEVRLPEKLTIGPQTVELKVPSKFSMEPRFAVASVPPGTGSGQPGFVVVADSQTGRIQAVEKVGFKPGYFGWSVD